MKSRVRKWGNSLAIRIPLILAEQSQLKKGAAVKIRVEDKKIIIQLIKKNMKLPELLAKINESNLSEKIEVMEFAGKEEY